MKFAPAFRFLILMVCVEESLSSVYIHSDHVNSCECGLEKDEGYCCNKHCYSKGNYFYYDTKSGKCRSLAYQGCGGNANKFHSMKECRKACRKGYGNKCEVCPPSTYVYASYCGCYEKGYCNCKPGYYCCPVTCGLPDKTPHKGYSCKKPIQVKCARGHNGGRKRKDNVRKNTKRHDNNGKGNVRKNTKRHDNNGKGKVRKNTKRHDNNGKGNVRKNTKRHDNNGKGKVRKNTKRHDNNGKGKVRKNTKRHDNNGKDYGGHGEYYEGSGYGA